MALVQLVLGGGRYATANLHLVTHLLCPYVQRSVIVLEEKGVPYQRKSVQYAVTPEYPELLLKFLRERGSYISIFALKVVV